MSQFESLQRQVELEVLEPLKAVLAETKVFVNPRLGSNDDIPLPRSESGVSQKILRKLLGCFGREPQSELLESLREFAQGKEDIALRERVLRFVQALERAQRAGELEDANNGFSGPRAGNHDSFQNQALQDFCDSLELFLLR